MTILDGIPFAAVATLAAGDLVLFDLCGLRLYGVFHREWAPGGVAVLPLAEGGDRVAAELATLERRLAVSVAVLRRGDATFDVARLDLLDGFDLERLHWLDLDPEGHLRCGGRPLAERPRSGRRFTFVLRGVQPLHVDAETLPLGVTVHSASVQSESWILGVEGGEEMPEPAWFQVPEPGDGKVGIGIVPGFDGDRWQMWLSGGVRPLPARPLAGRPFRPSAEAPFRLSLLFDRTAVDPVHWAAARGLRAAAAAGESLVSRNWNVGWRRTLSTFLASLPEAVEVDLWWFADRPGDGLDWPGHWPGPERCTGNLGRFSPGQAAREVEALDWVPGLDIWDSVDLALADLSDRVAAAPSHRHGVLIVGNSPPPPATRPSSHWARLRDAVGGNVRRPGRWEDCIHSVTARCAVACVQLPVGDGGVADAALLHSQALLREALETDGVLVVPSTGQPAQALATALDHLRTHVPSSLKVTP